MFPEVAEGEKEWIRAGKGDWTKEFLDKGHFSFSS
jgi:hypothetical protein